MANLSLSKIHNEVICKAICEIAEKSLKLKKYMINMSSASQEGENNFCGNIYRVVFDGKNESNKENHLKSSLIVKLAPQNMSRRFQFHSREMFLQEIYIYDEVLPFFRGFENSIKSIIEKDCFIEYPKCYHTFDDEFNECLLLEDLCVKGFSGIDRCNEKITADHVYLIMKTLGKFHAISLALKDQQPQSFYQLVSNIKDVFIRADITLFLKYYHEVVQNTLYILKDHEEEQLFTKVEKLFKKDANENLNDCLDLELTGFASVISYGDLWQNNTMFKYDDNGKPTEVSFLDWQIPCHSSPIIDIVYFIFCCTTKELRDAHYENFLNVYHESLTAHIQRLGSDAAQLFPYDMMQEHFRKFGKFGLLLATVILPLLSAEKGSGLNLDGMADDSSSDGTQIFSAYLSKSRDNYSKRLRDVVIDMIRLEYI